MGSTCFGVWDVKASISSSAAARTALLPAGCVAFTDVQHVRTSRACGTKMSKRHRTPVLLRLLEGCPSICNPSFCSDLAKFGTRVLCPTGRRCRHFVGTCDSLRCRATAKRNVVTSSLRTPHSGYHFDGSKRRFFEGWYFKVSLPEEKDSFAFMYSIEDPGQESSSSGKDTDVAGSLRDACTKSSDSHVGVGAQIMGPRDTYLMRYSRDVQHFWASPVELELGNAFDMAQRSAKKHPRSMIPADEFALNVDQGFQASTTFHQGVLFDDGSSPDVSTVPVAKWEYSTVPVYGWGNVVERQKATAGWLAALPVFEPHWQILMAAGRSTGWIEWGGKRFEFEDAPSYSEKNWGGSFPRKWFWVQCNVFEGATGTVALTAGGGRRGTPLAAGREEEVALIGIHYGGQFYEFVPWTGKVSWDIAPWGSWTMSAMTTDYEVELFATTDSEGVVLRAPTADAGLTQACRDTFSGTLQLKLWEVSNGRRGICILDVTSTMAALEVGGGPWWGRWVKESEMNEPVKSIVGLPLDVGSLLSHLPGGFSLPGL
ncbi:hypothetical protein CBR_g222 [Chara braunii]|uniref:Tocopherol cyclase n=1 Tax=Chara braunii TaxID=69332 RepID=A0A388JM27_CHABU|nr:hypothetical protein CBR_g222 [Chara braunii]|eukprot:GBG58821.1 hypothetical protein CBR_g222 [Chara braunii]